MTGIGDPRPRITIYSDGACSPNPGIGGWAAVLLGEGDRRREIWGAEAESTNQRMELMGAIEGLRALERPSEVTLHTDSTYVCNAFLKRWVANWLANGWRNAAKKPVVNKDLWLQLVELNGVHQVDWKWVPGHSGVKENDRCDELAVGARERLRDELGGSRGKQAR